MSLVASPTDATRRNIEDANPLVAVGRALRAATAAAVRQHSECVPNGTVLLSMVNEHQAPIRRLSLQLVGNLSCLMRRFVSLCWEGDYADGFGACVKGPPAAPPTFSRARTIR